MKKYLSLSLFLILLTGCAINNLNKPVPKSNPNLPIVKNFKGYPDRNAVALYWSIVKGAKGYYIQRYIPKTHKWKEIATIKDPYKSIYVDTNLKPNTIYKYRIAEYNSQGIPSLAVETTVKTLPKLSPVIPLEAKPITKGEVKIIFRPHPNERVSSYIIQRYDDKNAKWKTIATLSPRLNVEYIDKNLQDGKIYKYRIFAKSFDNILSYPSNVIVVSTFKRPPVITNLKATINLPKEIKLTWTPVKDAAYYKIYISNSANGPFEFYKSTKSTVFIDKINKDGFIRYYKVTAVSPHKTESLLNESPVVMGETLPAPAQPIVSSSLNGNQVELVFTSPDNRAAKYLIIRKEKIGLFKYQTKKFIVNKNNFIDTINPKKEYIYYVYEVDKHGLISKKPAEITIGG